MARRRNGRKARKVRRARRKTHRRRGVVSNTAGITPQNMYPYGVATSLLP